jgi:hypothetical protein
MGDAQEMRDMATELLTEFDERSVKAKLLVITQGVWNPAIGENDPQTIIESDLTGVASSYSQALINGSSIHKDDVKFVSTFEPVPTQADKVLLDGFEYGIESIKPYAYTGLDAVIAFEIQLRK